MTLINSAFKLVKSQLLKDLDQSSKDPTPFQEQWLRHLVSRGRNTAFGNDYGFGSISGLSAFQEQVPLSDYNHLEPYILRCLKGEENVLWDRKIYWFARSSGTSSAKSKFIPLNHECLHQCHFRGMQTILAQYVRLFPKSKLFQGKSLTLGGNRHIDKSVGTDICYGDLSAFLLINTPSIARMLTTPSKSIALIPDFETKMDIISQQILHQNLVSFSGAPSWNLILMRKVLEISGKENLHQVWPNMELFMHGGINFQPYKKQFQALFPDPKMHYLENYNASEGFFALQTDLSEPGMQLLANNGVFYEFIPLEQLEAAQNGTYTQFDTLETVRTGQVYALVITTNSGLWRYLIGDTIRFVSLKPHKILITGRTQLFINAFGEELMVENAENALAYACAQTHAVISDFTVAPVFMDQKRRGTHQWLIEFEQEPADMSAFEQILDRSLMDHNSDYEAKRIHTATMSAPIITVLPKGTFYSWLSANNRLGGQSKVPRLWSERKYVEELLAIANIH